MKKIVKYLFLALLIFTLGLLAKKYNLFDSVLLKKPKLSIIDNTKDFGIINKNDPGIVYFKFSNTGYSDLIISNIETKCGCTITDWNKKPIKPNQVDSIRIEYDTNIIGPFNKPISIYSNSDINPIYLHIIGIVKE